MTRVLIRAAAVTQSLASSQILRRITIILEKTWREEVLMDRCVAQVRFHKDRQPRKSQTRKNYRQNRGSEKRLVSLLLLLLLVLFLLRLVLITDFLLFIFLLCNSI